MFNIYNLYPDLILYKKLQLTGVIKNILASFSPLNSHFTFPNLRFKHLSWTTQGYKHNKNAKKMIYWRHERVTVSADKIT